MLVGNSKVHVEEEMAFPIANGRYPIAHDPEQEPIDNPRQRLTFENEDVRFRKRPDYLFDTDNGIARLWLFYASPVIENDLIREVRDKGRARGCTKMEILISQDAYSESMGWFTKYQFERDESRGAGDLLSFTRPL